MYILGINGATSAATLNKDGKIVAAAREERFNRLKHSDDFPTLAIKYCLEEAGITVEDVDEIVFAWNPGNEIEPFDTRHFIRDRRQFLHYVPTNVLNFIGGVKENKKISYINQAFGLPQKEMKIRFVNHHHSHAASAFFVSPFNEAAILTMDAYGDDTTTELFRGEGNSLTSLRKTKFPHSLGSFYAAITQYLGFMPNVDEWKVMGLSPYGKPTYYDRLKEVVQFNRESGELELDLSYFTYYIWAPRRYSDKFLATFGPERYQGDPLTERHQDLAASFQKIVEDVVLEMVDYLYNLTQLKNLCLAGGVAMNSVMNGRILRESKFEQLFIQPSADDAGASLGATFYIYHQIYRNPRCFVMEHDYWGPGYSNEDIKKILDGNLLNYQYIENIANKAAQLVAEGKIVGWFQGRMEFGQRALGNRSIIADPRDPKMKDKINKLVKHREGFRPFAPSILEEHCGEYFDDARPSPFMQKVYNILPEKQKLIPAVTHVDGTARLQTVNQKINPLYWQLLDEFRKLTSIPVVLNTSFNVMTEPIVCTPNDAIRCFYGTGLEALAIGNFLITK